MGKALARNVGMKLLIVTQAVDQNDPILGFFCRWLTEFAKQLESIEVICLREGAHSLPANVHVYSLGKPASRIYYVARFGWLIWKLRPKYDAVFVHMNPEYVILGGLDWRLMGKKIYFWYNHPNKDLRFKIAARLADKIFYTSRYSAGAKMPHALRMPAGIDTDLFKPQPVTRIQHALYMQGRITPSKHIKVALEALRLVRKEISGATLTLVGPEDPVYGTKLRKEFSDLLQAGAVVFVGPKPNSETPTLYSTHSISINLADNGHYDKSVLESIACGTPVVLYSKAFSSGHPREVIAPNEILIKERTPEKLAEMVLFVIREYPRWENEVARARGVVIVRESLAALSQGLLGAMYTL